MSSRTLSLFSYLVRVLKLFLLFVLCLLYLPPPQQVGAVGEFEVCVCTTYFLYVTLTKTRKSEGEERREESGRPPHLPSEQRQMASLPASINRYGWISVAALCALTATNVVQNASAHPNCIADFAPSMGVESTFCPNEYEDGFCCNAVEEASIQANFEAAGATGRCAEMHQEVRDNN